jgi:hypothetical protein
MDIGRLSARYLWWSGLLYSTVGRKRIRKLIGHLTGFTQIGQIYVAWEATNHR